MHVYGSSVADHYAAYRPPLHAPLLSEILNGRRTFSIGLDIGCGTGYSAAALANFCSHVVALDPSHAMLARNRERSDISLAQGRAEAIPLHENLTEIVTFAGSLNYVNPSRCGAELQRVCRPDATIAVYDFEVHLEAVLELLGIESAPDNDDYDHAASLADWPGFERVSHAIDTRRFEASSEEVTHLLLSDPHVNSAVLDKYGSDNGERVLWEALAKPVGSSELRATVYWSCYRLGQA